MIVRKAKKEDLETINRLTIELHRFLGKPLGLRFGKEILEEECYTPSDLKRRSIYVAIIWDKVVGYISFKDKIREDEWYGRHYVLDHFMVDPGCRGKGIGRKLFGALLQKARKAGVNIKADSLVTNAPGIRLYKKLGFRPLETCLVLDLQGHLKKL